MYFSGFITGFLAQRAFAQVLSLLAALDLLRCTVPCTILLQILITRARLCKFRRSPAARGARLGPWVGFGD